MNDTLKTVKEIERPQLILAFVVLAGLLAPGAAVIWAFDSTLVYEKDVSKLVFMSFVLTALPGLFNFVVISVFGLMRGHPRNTQRLSTEFTFSVLAVAISYSVMVFVSVIYKPGIVLFSICALLLNIVMVAVFVALMDKPEEQNT
jgi:hypothetical protein